MIWAAWLSLSTSLCHVYVPTPLSRQMSVFCTLCVPTEHEFHLQGIKVLGDCDFVAIFDADFKPEPDFLLRTVPYLIGNAEIGFVQTRWTFTNPEESYLTKVPSFPRTSTLSHHHHHCLPQHFHVQCSAPLRPLN